MTHTGDNHEFLDNKPYSEGVFQHESLPGNREVPLPDEAAAIGNAALHDIGNELLDGADALFYAEHKLPEAPRVDATTRFECVDGRLSDWSFLRHAGSTHTRTLDIFDEVNAPPPSLEEQIKNLEASDYDSEKISSRSGSFKRTRENFGQTFHIVTQFSLNTDDAIARLLARYDVDMGREEPRPVKKDPVKETGLTNQVALYRYLQQKGLVLIDDTGLAANATNSSDTNHKCGFLLLPASIDKELFFAFEDEVRKQVPISHKEIKLARLKGELAQGRQVGPEELVVDLRNVREIVDDLSLDERFMDMFTQSDSLQAARRQQRRQSL